MLSTSKLVIAPDWQTALRARLLDQFDALWNLTGDVVKHSSNNEVVRVTLDSHTVFLKKCSAPGGAQLGRSKVQREFETIRQLRAWGLDAPAPVAYGEHRRVGWLVRSLFVSEGIVEPVPLEEFIHETLPTRPQLRRELIERLADYVHRLHAHQFEHHALDWRNIVLSRAGLTHFYLLDAHKGAVWRQLKREREARTQDLATLDALAPAFFRRTERLRFLLRYLHKQHLDEDAKALAWLALAAAEPMRKRRLGRVREAIR